jgi:hypothetical protein
VKCCTYSRHHVKFEHDVHDASWWHRGRQLPELQVTRRLTADSGSRMIEPDGMQRTAMHGDWLAKSPNWIGCIRLTIPARPARAASSLVAGRGLVLIWVPHTGRPSSTATKAR